MVVTNGSGILLTLKCRSFIEGIPTSSRPNIKFKLLLPSGTWIPEQITFWRCGFARICIAREWTPFWQISDVSPLHSSVTSHTEKHSIDSNMPARLGFQILTKAGALPPDIIANAKTLSLQPRHQLPPVWIHSQKVHCENACVDPTESVQSAYREILQRACRKSTARAHQIAQVCKTTTHLIVFGMWVCCRNHQIAQVSKTATHLQSTCQSAATDWVLMI